MREYGHFIENRFVQRPDGQAIARHNPANDELVAMFAAGDERDVNEAVNAARSAFDDGPWPRMSAQERASVLYRWADLISVNASTLVDIEIAEVGKPRRLVEGDVAAAAALMRHAAGMAAQSHGETFTNLAYGKTGLVLREPCGVVATIIPWNFPIEIFSKKVPFALASGCSVIVKPSELTSGSALEVARLGVDAGLPSGVLSVVTGYGRDVGELISRHPGIDMVSFTGSTAVGQRVIVNSAESVKRVTVELGGKSANIVFDDADVDSAVEGTLFAIFGFQGQCCVAGSRLLLHDAIAEQFLERLLRRVDQLCIGDPRCAKTDLGSMISAQQVDRVMSLVDRGRGRAGTLLCGGQAIRPASGLTNNFILPTVFDKVPPDAEIFNQEVFGPVLCVSRFSTSEEAIRLANRTQYGLANTVWTSRLDTAMRLSRELRSGMVWINTTLDGAPQLPFGGIKASGYGRELGNAGFDDFTNLKTVILATSPFAAVLARNTG
jgi:betaine-aldehyde dehydrogenase